MSSVETTALADLALRYRNIRSFSDRLRQPLSPEDCQVQSMTDASPTKWHLAHTTWFFETFVLETQIPDYRHFSEAFRVLYNSYYNLVGRQYPRNRRGLVTRPTLDEVLAYRAHVDEHMTKLLEKGIDDGDLRFVIATGLNHEQQHQELILTDIKHALSFNPLHPAYEPEPLPVSSRAAELTWEGFEEGLRWIGSDGEGFIYDNEAPRHRVFVEAFEIASRLTTNEEYLAFIEDGGYSRPELWLSEGWAKIQETGWDGPMYWIEREGERFVFTLRGLQPLDGSEPVCHLSYFEADAFARWSGARLPTEAEWETIAAGAAVDGTFVDDGRFHPAAAKPSATQLYGDVWEWTRSPYSPYPGYRPLDGALGEYNGKFMSSQIVLRGGSCATSRSHIRDTYRNFFPPDTRWQFNGVRLARDA